MKEGNTFHCFKPQKLSKNIGFSCLNLVFLQLAHLSHIDSKLHVAGIQRAFTECHENSEETWGRRHKTIYNAALKELRPIRR